MKLPNLSKTIYDKLEYQDNSLHMASRILNKLILEKQDGFPQRRGRGLSLSGPNGRGT